MLFIPGFIDFVNIISFSSDFLLAIHVLFLKLLLIVPLSICFLFVLITEALVIFS